MDTFKQQMSGSIGFNDTQFSETHHVHEVYENIASHFSLTRHKPWPIVEQFLMGLPPGSCGLDVGCGNGKYIGLNRDIFIVASDRSVNLSFIASHKKQNEVLTADGIDLPHPSGRFDFAICIAVIHHFTTAGRRILAIKAILDTLKAGGQCLILVWALEQRDSRRGWTEESEQDILVPWIKPRLSGRDFTTTETFLRYYHLYRQGELEANVMAAGGQVLDAGYERDNWWVIAETSRNV